MIITDEELSRFANSEGKCMACANWHDMSSCEPLTDYECQYCESTVFMPMRISEFWLYAVAGEGGMGRVYMARSVGDPKIYAIKLSEYTSENDFRFQSLLYEGEIVMELDHPNIVKTHRFGYKAGKAFLLMDFIPGQPLDEYIQNNDVSETEVVDWMTQVTEALHYMAQKNLLYRDLKPQNIMIKDGKITLVDFGLAMHTDHNLDIDEENLVGSPAYIPPERINGQPEDFRSDIYALGMVFFYIAMGYDYFQGTPQEIVEYHTHPHRYDAAEILPGFSPEFHIVFNALIAYDPEQRYQHFEGLHDDLLILRDNLILV